MSNVDIIRPSLDQLMSLLGSWIVCGYYDESSGEKYESSPCQLVGALTAAPGTNMQHQIFLDSWVGGQPAAGFEYEVDLSEVRYIRTIDPPALALSGRVSEAD
ncbi:hypothetical protein B597_020655 [Stutzerimonas stutzeri KOS6]|uniref:Uncharacterized protein n=1 Tax=Stutzerimonas stutzeri KOS6 TaxID=1218352 RepID=A0A061JM29_STUST|nr:hypothetical protein B597_020655 [Stutzerimonas stutzeri KOS6]